jgi:predicted hotdog family 3-hydroxylacyl-ACP dehydratase
MKKNFRILDVVPHQTPMSLLDTVESYSDKTLVSSVTIKEDSLFYEELGVPTWVGLEYMGQSIAAFGGVEARNEGRPVKIGFLVSSRRYESPQSHFKLGSKLIVFVEKVINNPYGLSVFNCSITWSDFIIQANLNVFLPDKVEEFLEGAV